MLNAIPLKEQHCDACRADAPRLSEGALAELQKTLPQWKIITVDSIAQLERAFLFANFSEAMAFAQAVGELAEAEGHHPALLVEWGRVTVRWWTHKIGGLHRNDVLMAAKNNSLPL